VVDHIAATLMNCVACDAFSIADSAIFYIEYWTGSVGRMPASESVSAAISSFAHKVAIQVSRLAYAAAHINHTTHRLEGCVVARSHYDWSPVGNTGTSGLQRCCLSCLCGARNNPAVANPPSDLCMTGSPEQWSASSTLNGDLTRTAPVLGDELEGDLRDPYIIRDSASN